MNRPRLLATAVLIAGLLLSVGTPAYLAHAAPYLAVYLRHPVILLGQGVPYLVCAAIWLPWRRRDTAMTALILAGLLLIAGLLLYVPMLRAPTARGGDMIGLAFMLITAVTTLALLIASAIAAVILWRRERDRRASSIPG